MSILLDIVVPVFGLVGLGYAAAMAGLFDAERLKGLAYFAFGFAIPALLLRSMARMELEELAGLWEPLLELALPPVIKAHLMDLNARTQKALSIDD